MITRNPYPLLFLDLETTGHDPLARIGDHLIPWHEVIDIGAVLVDQEGLEVVGEFQEKVRPIHPERCLPDLVNNYKERAAHGEWDGALALPDAIRQLLNFAKSRGTVSIPGGQNFFFDWTFLTVALAWCGISEGEWRKYIHYTRFDTRSMAVQALLDPGQIYDPQEFSMRNNRLLLRLGIEPEAEVHEAINGARKAFEVFRKLRAL